MEKQTFTAAMTLAPIQVEEPTQPLKPQKVVRRSVAAALGIVCILLVAGLIGALVYHTDVVNDEKNNQINSVNNAISSLNSQISQLNETIASLNSQVSRLNATISYIQLNETISSLNSQISQLNGTISSLNSQVSQLNTSISNIQGEKTVGIQIYASDPNDHYSRTWDVVFDRAMPPLTAGGDHVGSDVDEAHYSGDVMPFTWNLASGAHYLIFDVTQGGDPANGVYNGTITVEGTTYNFTGVDWNHTVKINFTVP